ncbi:MAG: UDP-glucose 4-epimerase GalE [Kiritimatiellae bacterium]|nr:UDP-glucose 4-epimerase GalE [Kiritimatiellia bacterium]
MKIFLTGGAGYIGSITSELLLDAGHEVVVFDNLERGHAEALDPRARFVRGDLRERGQILDALAAARPEAVMHFAAYALVGESMQDPQLYFRNNVAGGVNLLDAALAQKVRKFIFSSTCATYGVPDRLPMTEETAQRPANPYGESKLMFEKILAWAQQLHGIEPVFLRYFNACGATKKLGEDHEPETHLIPNVMRTALGRQPAVQMFGDDYDTPDGTCIRDYIHIVDLAQAHILALREGISGAFNLGNGEGFSVKQVIEAAREVTGLPIPVNQAPRRPGDPPRLVAAARKAAAVLGWKPKYPDLRTILQHAWAWHQAHPRGYAP